MAKPNQPKEIKPKTENDKSMKVPMDSNLRLVLINIVSMLLICVVFVGVNYLLQDSLLSTKMSQLSNPDETATDETATDEDVVERGIIVDVGDFSFNWCGVIE